MRSQKCTFSTVLCSKQGFLSFLQFVRRKLPKVANPTHPCPFTEPSKLRTRNCQKNWRRRVLTCQQTTTVRNQASMQLPSGLTNEHYLEYCRFIGSSLWIFGWNVESSTAEYQQKVSSDYGQQRKKQWAVLFFLTKYLTCNDTTGANWRTAKGLLLGAIYLVYMGFVEYYLDLSGLKRASMVSTLLSKSR